MEKQFIFLIKRCGLFPLFVSKTKHQYSSKQLKNYFDKEIKQTKETLEKDWFGVLSLSEFGITSTWKYSEILADDKKWCFVLFLRFILGVETRQIRFYTPMMRTTIINNAYILLFHGENNN